MAEVREVDQLGVSTDLWDINTIYLTLFKQQSGGTNQSLLDSNRCPDTEAQVRYE